MRDKDERKEEGEMKNAGTELWAIAATTYGNLPTNLRVTTQTTCALQARRVVDLTLAGVPAASQ